MDNNKSLPDSKFNKIKNKIDSEPTIYYFKIEKSQARMLVKGDNKTDLKNDLKKMINTKKKKGSLEYGDEIWRVIIKFHSNRELDVRVSIIDNNSQ